MIRLITILIYYYALQNIILKTICCDIYTLAPLAHIIICRGYS